MPRRYVSAPSAAPPGIERCSVRLAEALLLHLLHGQLQVVRVILRPLTLMALAAVTLTACQALDARLRCELIADDSDKIGRVVHLDWDEWPSPHVSLNGFTHRVGDGTTLHVHIADDETFVLVHLQDVMRLTGPDGAPQRWAKAMHWTLARTANAGAVLRLRSVTLGRAEEKVVQDARAGHYRYRPVKTWDYETVWACQ